MALVSEWEAKVGGSLAASELMRGDKQAMQNATILPLWGRSESRGGREASHGRILAGVERKQFMTHLRTRFQRTVILLTMAELGTRRSAPYVMLGRIRPETSLQFMWGARPMPQGESCLMIENAPCANTRHL